MTETAAAHQHPSRLPKRRRAIPWCLGLTETGNHGVEGALREFQGCGVHQPELEGRETRLGGIFSRFLQHLGRRIDSDDVPWLPDTSRRRERRASRPRADVENPVTPLHFCEVEESFPDGGDGGDVVAVPHPCDPVVPFDQELLISLLLQGFQGGLRAMTFCWTPSL